MCDVACRLRYETYINGKQRVTTCTQIPDKQALQKSWFCRYVVLDAFGDGAERP